MANVDTKIYDALKDKEFTIENVLKIIRGLLVEEVEQMEKQRANNSNKASKANNQYVVKDNNTSVTIKELDFIRNRVISEYYNGNVTKDEREMLCTCFGFLNRLQIKGCSNPYNTEIGVDDIQYPFNNTITELLRMSNDEFTKFREIMIMMFNTISIVKTGLPKKE